MSILYIIIGFALGLGGKWSLDEYHNYQKNQENQLARADELYTKMKALEIMKENKII